MDKIRRYLHRRRPSKTDKDILLKRAIQDLKEKGYRKIKLIGEGTYGNVILTKRQETNKTVAVKIIALDKTSEGERNSWSNFQHENVLPLVQFIPTETFNLFLMPYHKQTLNRVLAKKSFRNNRWGFEITKIWVRDILSGIEYLHHEGICHLDLKADNVLISSNKKAIICDFSCINKTEGLVRRYGLMFYDRPPETCQSYGECPEVGGIGFDIWSLGMLMLYFWTRHWLKLHVHELRSWRENMYPLMFEILQYPVFRTRLKEAYPRARFKATDIILALNIVRGALRYAPEDRPEASVLLKHPLWSGHGIMYDTDLMWYILGRLPAEGKRQEVQEDRKSSIMKAL